MTGIPPSSFGLLAYSISIVGRRCVTFRLVGIPGTATADNITTLQPVPNAAAAADV